MGRPKGNKNKKQSVSKTKKEPVFSLNPDEQETHINMAYGENKWTIYTDYTKHINELKRKGHELIPHGVGFICEIDITIRQKGGRKVSAKTKAKLAENLAKAREAKENAY
ncbi:MAG: hypothetical protein KDC52_10290 [Ignavibacteriae bacterium]|nr:hypothetical protein [Ignavibacteriota bacterium]